MIALRVLLLRRFDTPRRGPSSAHVCAVIALPCVACARVSVRCASPFVTSPVNSGSVQAPRARCCCCARRRAPPPHLVLCKFSSRCSSTTAVSRRRFSASQAAFSALPSVLPAEPLKVVSAFSAVWHDSLSEATTLFCCAMARSRWPRPPLQPAAPPAPPLPPPPVPPLCWLARVVRRAGGESSGSSSSEESWAGVPVRLRQRRQLSGCDATTCAPRRRACASPPCPPALASAPAAAPPRAGKTAQRSSSGAPAGNVQLRAPWQRPWQRASGRASQQASAWPRPCRRPWLPAAAACAGSQSACDETV